MRVCVILSKWEILPYICNGTQKKKKKKMSMMLIRPTGLNSLSNFTNIDRALCEIVNAEVVASSYSRGIDEVQGRSG